MRVEGFCGAIAYRLAAAIRREVTKTLTLSLEIGTLMIKDYPVYDFKAAECEILSHRPCAVRRITEITNNPFIFSEKQTRTIEEEAVSTLVAAASLLDRKCRARDARASDLALLS